ncbi:hypothetical protein HBA54_21930 [Pelagibius litoralis]|uniref:Uncharacterized protein n=1 Tax=Pelagibius litoralis TaxID=374515 RepID=A0A967KD78_9PROT|nr:hypothetical protein [Pelagibius litoralis]NIA71264.1 hypothetical protein [Pelagibius litoralis]
MTKGTLRLTRRELYDRVWKTPVDQLAKELGMSGRGLAKVCERHGIPVPPRGYWARKSAGQRVKRPSLLDIADPRYPEVPVNLRLRKPSDTPVEEQTPITPSPGRELFDRLLEEIGPLKVPRQLRNPHRIIRDWLNEEQIELERTRDSLYGRRKSKSVLATPLARRRLRILDTLFRELERRGFKVQAERSHWAGVWALHGHDRVDMNFYERVLSQRQRLSPEEAAKMGLAGRKWIETREATGALDFSVKSWLPKDVPSSWGDEEGKPLETKIAEMLAGIMAAAGQEAARREQREEEERQRYREAEEQRRLEAEYRAERLKEVALQQRAAAWRLAGDLRSYVAAILSAVADGGLQANEEDLERWLTWARGHADAIDPLSSGDALGTELLCEEDAVQHDSHTHFSPTNTLADPGWFWGHRWWLKG